MNQNCFDVNSLYNSEFLTEIVTREIDSFNSKERDLIENNLSEQCICSKFAHYLESPIRKVNRELKQYYKDNELNSYGQVCPFFHVDVEYNRGYQKHEHYIKQLHDKNVILDLVVHDRRYDQDRGFNNLLCIEMKKTTNSVGTAADRERLKALTSSQNGYGYSMGFLIMIETRKHYEPKLWVAYSYLNGEEYEWVNI